MRRPPSRPTAPSSLSELPDTTSPPTVPKLIKDPVMSLCPWSVDVAVGHGQSIEIPAQPAVEWLRYLLSTEPDINAMISNLMTDLEDYYYDNELDIIDLYRVALDVVSIVSARSWWITLRLTYAAADNWHILGPKMMFHGVDPTIVSYSAWLDAVLFLMIENMDPKNVTMFNMKLEMPPPKHILTGDEVETAEPVMDRSAFLAFAE